MATTRKKQDHYCQIHENVQGIIFLLQLFLHSILKRLLHFHNLFVKLLATHYIDVSIHKHLLYCLPEMRSIKVSLNIMDLIEAQIRRYRNAEFLMKISRNA